MYRIEMLDERQTRGRWVPVSDAKYTTLERAQRARHEAVEKALEVAKKTGAWRTPRFRIVGCAQVVACMVLQ